MLVALMEQSNAAKIDKPVTNINDRIDSKRRE